MALSAPDAELIVRMFRLPPPTPASIRWLLGLVALLVLGLFFLVEWQRRRDRRRRSEAEAAGLQRKISAARLNPEETAAFLEVARHSGAPPLLCAAAVELFDRGLEMLLRQPMAEIDRVERIRTLRSLRRKLGLHAPRRGVPIRSTRMLPANLPVLVGPAGPPLETGPVPGTLVSASEDLLTIRLDGPPGEAARPLRGHGELEVIFFSPGDACYNFRAPVAGIRELGAAFLLLSHPGVLSRVQRREARRVEVERPVAFRWVVENGLGKERRGARRQIPEAEQPAVVTSLSASGLRLRTAALLEPADLIQVTLPFLPPPLGSEVCFARVVRLLGEGSFGLTFTGMAPRIQAGIFQYVRHLETQSAGAPAGEAVTRRSA
jgi:c-di-GMP-binding flagellar brake protein YcgR